MTFCHQLKLPAQDGKSQEGGQIAKNARQDIENRLGQKVISPINATNKNLLKVEQDEDN